MKTFTGRIDPATNSYNVLMKSGRVPTSHSSIASMTRVVCGDAWRRLARMSLLSSNFSPPEENPDFFFRS